jgi:hypothetical protein
MTAPAEDAGSPSRLRGLARLRSRARAGGKTTAAHRAGDFVRREQRLVSAAVLFIAGIVFVLLGWYGAAHTNILTEQIPYLISGGLLGMGLIIVAGVIASSAAVERDNRELRAVIARALSSAGTRPDLDAASSRPPVIYTVPGGQSYHVSGCPILEGKDGVAEVTRGDAARAGLPPCKLCGPE